MFGVDIHWRDLIALTAFAGIVGGLLIAWIKYRLTGEFASSGAIQGLNDRLERLEQQVAAVPSQADMRGMAERIGAVERQVDVVGAEVRGVSNGVARIEHGLNMITAHLLRAEKGP